MAVVLRPSQAMKLMHDVSLALVRDGEPDLSSRQLAILLTIYSSRRRITSATSPASSASPSR